MFAIQLQQVGGVEANQGRVFKGGEIEAPGYDLDKWKFRAIINI